MIDFPQWDTDLFLYLNNLGNSFWDPFWLAVSGVKIWIPFYAILLFLVVKNIEGKTMWAAILLAFLNVVLTDQGSVILFKEFFLRLRPCQEPDLIIQMRLVKAGCGGMYGFVSSHAANTFGLAIFIGMVLRRSLKWLLPVMLVWAAVVSYSRIYLGVHYPLDIIAGGVYGIICGFISFGIYNYFKKRWQ